MATTAKHLSSIVRASSPRLSCRACRQTTTNFLRPFTSSSRLHADEPLDVDQQISSVVKFDKGLTISERKDIEDSSLIKDYLQSALTSRNINDELRDFESMVPEDEPVMKEPKITQGFFSLGEESEDPGEDPEFEADDISTTAHAELEQVREMREFARVMAWDMPLLYNHAIPFQAPSDAQPLRFRYTTYLGETHPAARKVVVSYSPTAPAFGLTDIQSAKLIKLVGARYNPSTATVKMSCELFATPAQNKRHLCGLVNKLLAEAKDPKDTFEDVPFDFRYHTPKKTFEFPEEWKMTAERKEMLRAKREAREQREAERLGTGEVVEGRGVIELMLAGGGQAGLPMPAFEPAMATVGAGKARASTRPQTLLR